MKPLLYASLSNGIAPETAAWNPLGWQCAYARGGSDFENDVVRKHWKHPLSFTKMEDEIYEESIEVIFSRAKLQPFSIAEFDALVRQKTANDALDLLGSIKRNAPRWLVWAGVTGVLSDADRSFETFLQGLAKLGYGFAYRVLDAQHFGVPLRLRRLYLVAHAGGAWQRCASVLFNEESLRGDFTSHPKEGDEDQSDFTGSLEEGSVEKYKIFAPRIAAPLHAGDASRKSHSKLTGTDRTTLIIETSTTADVAGIRRLSVLEYERLMGFADDYTKLGTYENEMALRYNSVATSVPVPVLRWIAERINLVESL